MSLETLHADNSVLTIKIPKGAEGCKSERKTDIKPDDLPCRYARYQSGRRTLFQITGRCLRV
ncbi:hypothetical protein [Rhizobium mongolense]|uniref:Uncharacterized protein n=2 Tax=Rhizobium mongolense TaxID=57676 RepID=A0ABR6IG41_9HYPH|nr:hypothetical protein [Rhizobium mongolense]MBB4226829.1 hypothetical protein [Rhizobium mongolense]TVZ74052.1 hypothetical protein BCL32_2360 [Rhizobium mongolense USDA 1844]